MVAVVFEIFSRYDINIFIYLSLYLSPYAYPLSLSYPWLYANTIGSHIDQVCWAGLRDDEPPCKPEVCKHHSICCITLHRGSSIHILLYTGGPISIYVLLYNGGPQSIYYFTPGSSIHIKFSLRVFYPYIALYRGSSTSI